MVMLDSSQHPLVYVVILNWNGWQDSVRCLHSLSTVTQPLCHLLVDNGSTDDSVDYLRETFPDLNIMETGRNLGFAGGNNVGIKYALAQGADYVLLLNNDTVVDPDFVQPLLQVLEKDTTVAAVNPKIYFLHEMNRLWATGGTTRFWLAYSGNRGRGKLDRGQFDEVETVDFGTGCCLLIRRNVLEEVGLFDTDYFAYYEDLDWSCRAQRHGYNIKFVPESKIWHAVGSASKNEGGQQSAYVHFLVARNQLWALRTYAGSVRGLAYIAYFVRRLLFYSGVFILLRRWAKFSALWRGFWAGMVSSPRGYNVIESDGFDGIAQ